jgi:acyl carrier protein
MLGVSGASPDDNVESLGGDSVQAIDVQLKLEQRFGISFPEEIIEQRPSIRKVAQFVNRSAEHAAIVGAVQ